MIKNILSGKKSLVAGALAIVILTVFRVFVLLYGVDFTDGLYSREGNIFNIVYYILLGVMAVVIFFTAWMDIKKPQKSYKTEIGSRWLLAIGALMIAAGALQAIQVVNEFATGINIFSVFLIIGCIAHVLGGIMIASAKKLKPAYCVIAMGVIISQIGQLVEFYMSNSLISKNPQKLMLILFLATSSFFWIYFGRILSGDERLTAKLLTVAIGFFSTALSLAFIISSFVLLAIDGEKWINLSYLPGLTFIPVMLIPAVTAASVLLSGKGKTVADNESKEETAISDNDSKEETAQ